MEKLGTNVTGLKKRSVEDCLNCTKDDCKGCNDTTERNHKAYLKRKERKQWAAAQNAVEERSRDHRLRSKVESLSASGSVRSAEESLRRSNNRRTMRLT